jgi:preprotein translocase SecE subunit
MARDRKRAKQRQRRAAQRQPQGARADSQPKPEPQPDAEAEEVDALPADGSDADHTIADLQHGSADADIAKAAIAAGSVNPEEVSEELDAEAGHRASRGEIFPDELGDDGDDDSEDAASAAVGRPGRRERAARKRGGGNRLTTFLRNSWEELKRVQWPDRRQVAQATAVVIGFVIIIGLYLGAADFVFSKLVDAII